MADLFGRKLLDFAEDVQPLIGHMPAYTLVTSGIKWMCNFDPQKNVDLFKDYVAKPYGSRIESKDESFFLTAELGSSGHENTLVDMIRNVWTIGLTAQDKEAVWAHLQVLLLLSRRCA